MLRLTALVLLLAFPGDAQTKMHKVTGSFDVKLAPLQSEDKEIGRMRFDKQFHGPLEAVSVGQMLTGMTAIKDSGAYVAVERVTGTLDGRKGGFTLVHKGLMARGAQSLEVMVVPDSGTGELTGIHGTLQIRIEAGGKHFYDFEYAISDKTEQ